MAVWLSGNGIARIN